MGRSHTTQRARGRLTRTSVGVAGLLVLAAAGVAVGVVLVVSGIIVAHIDDVGHCPLFETASRCPSMAPREVGGALLMVAGALVALVAARLGRHSGQSPP